MESEFFNEIYNNFKKSKHDNIPIRSLIKTIDNNLKKFSELGYYGISVIIESKYSKTAPKPVFKILEKHYEDLGFIVEVHYNYIRIYWEYSADDSIATICIEYPGT